MAWYRTGTISINTGEKIFTRLGTTFVSAPNVKVGHIFVTADGAIGEIATITSETTGTLVDNYGGVSVSGVAYMVVPTTSLTDDLVTEVQTLITTFTDIANGIGAGKFPDGTLGTLAAYFTDDQDSGIYRSASGTWHMVSNGVAIVDVTPTGASVNGAFTASGPSTLSGAVSIGGAVDGNNNIFSDVQAITVNKDAFIGGDNNNEIHLGEADLNVSVGGLSATALSRASPTSGRIAYFSGANNDFLPLGDTDYATFMAAFPFAYSVSELSDYAAFKVAHGVTLVNSFTVSVGGDVMAVGGIGMGGDFLPITTNTSDVGSATFAMADGYFQNSITVTSDGRDKNLRVVESGELSGLLTDAELRAYLKCGTLARIWKWKDQFEAGETKPVTKYRNVTKLVPKTTMAIEIVNDKAIETSTTKQVPIDQYKEYPLYEADGITLKKHSVQVGVTKEGKPILEMLPVPPHREPIMEAYEDNKIIKAEVNETYSRWHTGPIVQDCVAAFEAEGLNPSDYAWFRLADKADPTSKKMLLPIEMLFGITQAQGLALATLMEK